MPWFIYRTFKRTLSGLSAPIKDRPDSTINPDSKRTLSGVEAGACRAVSPCKTGSAGDCKSSAKGENLRTSISTYQIPKG